MAQVVEHLPSKHEALRIRIYLLVLKDFFNVKLSL
jgi:hypothetical protein